MSDAKHGDAIRLNLTHALTDLPQTLTYTDTGVIKSIDTAKVATDIGAPILRRKNTGDPAYHLACVHDDNAQRITHVIRGLDVAPLTQIHVILQHIMGWSSPEYRHHKLITDDTGKRLAKIDKSKSIAAYRTEGMSPNDIRIMVGLPQSPGQ
jgi:glutamyl-Q tRNA(Asp) synthetase